VVDASISISWCFQDETSSRSERLLDGVLSDGAIVPVIWPLEVINAFVSAEAAKRIVVDERNTQLAFLMNLPISIDGPPGIDESREIAMLARAYNLTAYDSAYLRLAQRMGLPLATDDKALVRVARTVGVALL
jgi:predicted nucleic acid-binding protein